MALVLNGSANTIGGLAVGGLPDGSVDSDTLAANAVTTAKILDSNVTGGKLASGAGGKILQVVSLAHDTHMNSNATTYTDITDYTLAITPNAVGNKILIHATLCISKYNNHSFLGRMLRDTTVLPGGDVANSNQDSDVWWNVRGSIYSAEPYTQVYLDTVPGTWSSGAITYRIKGIADTSVDMYINRRSSSDSYGLSSTITLMEVVA